MVTTSVRGVLYRPDCKTNPYCFQTMVNGVTKYRWFPTFEAAAKAKTAKESAKVASAIAKRGTLKEKRARDLQIYGNNSNQERDASIEVKTCADATYGPGTAIVMNDGTRADVLFKKAESYLQLQLKTTATKAKKNENGYLFKNVIGYAGMLVVCWVVDLKKAWVFDGTWLDERGQRYLNFTPGLETHALGKALTMDGLVAYLHDHTHAAHLRLTTEDAARNDFKGKNNKKEKFGIDAYMTFKPGTHDWPRDQNGTYDTTLRTCEDDDKTLRVQHKSCYPYRKQAGLYCPDLGKRDGTDLNRKQLHTCYDKDDADLYVFHYHHEPTNTSHFWEIPSEALAEHGYFTKTTKKETITLYGCPVAKQPNPNARKKADTWTSAFYTGELKHA